MLLTFQRNNYIATKLRTHVTYVMIMWSYTSSCFVQVPSQQRWKISGGLHVWKEKVKVICDAHQGWGATLSRRLLLQTQIRATCMEYAWPFGVTLVGQQVFAIRMQQLMVSQVFTFTLTKLWTLAINDCFSSILHIPSSFQLACIHTIWSSPKMRTF